MPMYDVPNLEALARLMDGRAQQCQRMADVARITGDVKQEAIMFGQSSTWQAAAAMVRATTIRGEG